MSRSNYDPDPTADSYYDRLGVSKQARPATVKHAAETAFDSLHSDADADALLAVKQARDALVDSMLRRTYDLFLDELTAAAATQAFEQWQAHGEPKPNTWLEGYRHVCSDDASPTASADAGASDDADPNPVYGGTVSDAPTIE
jgi:DnaJ-class molecular chaperone